MKKLIVAALLALVLLTPAFCFGYISLLQNENKIVVSPDVYFGTWQPLAPVSYFGAGANAEMNVLMPNLYVGGGLHYDQITIDSASGSDIALSLYGKYYLYTPEQSKKLVGLPLALGGALGFGYNQWFVSWDDVGYASYTSPLRLLAVGIVGYEFPLWGKNAIASASIGYVDSAFGYYLDLYYPLSKTTSLHLNWVPLIGVGAALTLAM